MQCEMKLLCPHSVLGFGITLCCYKCSVFYMLRVGRCWWSGHSWGECHCSLLCSRCWSPNCFFSGYPLHPGENCSYSPHWLWRLHSNSYKWVMCVFSPHIFLLWMLPPNSPSNKCRELATDEEWLMKAEFISVCVFFGNLYFSGASFLYSWPSNSTFTI